MADIKLTDTEIIKALEICSSVNANCEECPCFNKDCISTTPYVLDLINRQQANIDRLKRERDKYIDVNMFLSKLTDEQQDKLVKYEHIESTINSFWSGLQQLSILKDKDTPTLEELLEYIEQVKAAAYKEFAERLKEYLRLQPKFNVSRKRVKSIGFSFSDVFFSINKILKELSG